MSKVKVLFFAADPQASGEGSDSRLRLDEDVRRIREKVRAAEYRDALDFDVRWATRPDDLIQAFNESRPQIVHFSGHGTKSGLVFVGESQRPQTVPTAALARLFRIFGGGVRVVVLNACYSSVQAKAIVQFVDCAVGTRGLIPDTAAITFGASFYRAIGFGNSVHEAYEQASLAISMEGYSDAHCPVLLARDGVDPTKIFLVSPPGKSVQQFVNVGYSARSFGLFPSRDYDIGTLSVTGQEAVFEGEKHNVRIAGVWDVSDGRQGGDALANWVKIRYGDQEHPSVAYFSRQPMLGSVLGAEEEMFLALQSMLDAR